jgi:hypothetical protein
MPGGDGRPRLPQLQGLATAIQAELSAEPAQYRSPAGVTQPRSSPRPTPADTALIQRKQWLLQFEPTQAKSSPRARQSGQVSAARDQRLSPFGATPAGSSRSTSGHLRAHRSEAPQREQSLLTSAPEPWPPPFGGTQAKSSTPPAWTLQTQRTLDLPLRAKGSGIPGSSHGPGDLDWTHPDHLQPDRANSLDTEGAAWLPPGQVTCPPSGGAVGLQSRQASSSQSGRPAGLRSGGTIDPQSNVKGPIGATEDTTTARSGSLWDFFEEWATGRGAVEEGAAEDPYDAATCSAELWEFFEKWATESDATEGDAARTPSAFGPTAGDSISDVGSAGSSLAKVSITKARGICERIRQNPSHQFPLNPNRHNFANTSYSNRASKEDHHR